MLEPTALPVLEGRGLTKRYGPIAALTDVDIAIHAGEIVGLVGDNGAGKSTLVKLLSGALQPTAGEILLDGEPTSAITSLQARRRGVETVHQDLALAPDLTIAENLFLGREPKRHGIAGLFRWMDRGKMNRESEAQLKRLGIRISSVRDRCDALSGGQRQAVAVARAVAWGTRVVLMDEPTASLGVEEQARVGALIAEVARSGVPVLLVSHNIPQVHDLCDRVVVLFRGRLVADLRTEAVDVDDVVRWITGTALPKPEPSVANGGGNDA